MEMEVPIELTQQRERLHSVIEQQLQIEQDLNVLQQKYQNLANERQTLETEIDNQLQTLEDDKIENEKTINEGNAIPNQSDGDVDSNESSDSEHVQESGNYLSTDDDRRNDRVALASYPRSGNSLLRKTLEDLTLITTGSDSDPKRPLIQHLIEMGMVGEGIVDDRVWCVKTHFPERLGYEKFLIKRAIIIIRNPFDAIVSYFNMVLTQTHTLSIENTEFLKYASIWDKFLKEEIEIWKTFHAHWETLKETPTFLVRYEDLVQHRPETLRKIAQYLYKTDVLTPEIEGRIENMLKVSQEDAGVYKPRSAWHVEDSQIKQSTSDSDGEKTEQHLPLEKNAGGYLKSLQYYTKSQIEFILHCAKDELHKYGYWDSFQDEFGPYYEIRKPGKCLIERKDCKKVKLNARFGIRPKTEDDPFARGFGKRWKAEVSRLPPPKVIKKTK